MVSLVYALSLLVFEQALSDVSKLAMDFVDDDLIYDLMIENCRVGEHDMIDWMKCVAMRRMFSLRMLVPNFDSYPANVVMRVAAIR